MKTVKKKFYHHVSAATLAVFVGQTICPALALSVYASPASDQYEHKETSKQVDADSCDDAGTDKVANEHCKMKKVAVATAVTQAVEATAYTASGTVGVLACVAQSASKTADEASKDALPPLEAAAKVLVTAGTATEVASKEAATASSALEAAVAKLATANTELNVTWAAATTALLTPISTAVKALGPCGAEAIPASADVDMTLAKLAASTSESNAATVALSSKIPELVADQTALTKSTTMGDPTSTTGSTTAYQAKLATQSPGMETAYAVPSNLEKATPAAAAAGGKTDAISTYSPSLAAREKFRETALLLESQDFGAVKVADSASKIATQKYTTDVTALTAALSSYETKIKVNTSAVTTLLLAASKLNLSLSAANASKCTNVTGVACCGPLGAALTAINAAMPKVDPGEGLNTNFEASAFDAISRAHGLSGAVTKAEFAAGQFSGQTAVVEAASHTYVAAVEASLKARIAREAKAKIYNVAQIAAFGADIAGGGAVIAASLAVGAKVDLMGIASGAVAGGAGMLMKDQGKKGDDLSCGLPMACYLMDFMQAGMRTANMIKSIATANESDKYQKELKGDQVTFKGSSVTGSVSGGSAASSGGDGGASSGGEPKITRSMPPEERHKLTPKSIATSLATAQQRQVLPKMLEQMTGNSGEQLAGRLLNGETPMMAATGMLGSNAGGEARALAALDQNFDKYMEAGKAELAATMAKPQEVAFESTSGKRKVASSSSADPGLDVAALMANLMKKPEAPAGAPAPAAPVAAKTATKADNEGLYPKEKSLFEAIGTRYQLVQQRFLEGATLGTTASAAPSSTTPSTSVLPKNLYLRK